MKENQWAEHPSYRGSSVEEPFYSMCKAQYLISHTEKTNKQTNDVMSTAEDAPSIASFTAWDMYLLRWKPNVTVFKKLDEIMS